MPDMYTEEYANWKEEYQQQSLDLLADVRYSLGQSPDQRQRMEYASSTMAGVDKKLLKQEADKFILRQKLDKVANAYSVPGKIEEIKQVAKIQGVEINTFELDFLIAESLQKMDAGEDPRAEYYDWIEAQKKIENDINSNGTTEEEIIARNSFLNFLDDRETEMRRIIALYAGAAVYGNGPLKEQALERLAFLNFKMSELRRLRVRTQATKDKADTREGYASELAERSAQLATGAVMAAGAMAIARDNMANRYLRMKAGIDSREFERGIGEEFVRFRPVTSSREEAENKIDIAKRNRQKMAIVLTAMRMGKSREEVERETADAAMPPKIRSLNGFRMARYRDIYERSRQQV